MENPRSVILTVILANVNIATQEILEKADEVDAFNFQEEFGKNRPDVKDLVSWNAELENTHGKLTTLEEYFVAHPLKLI
jgi:hypothetical protein